MELSESPRVLALDIGGTKTLLALVQGKQIIEVQSHATDRQGTPDGWLTQAAALAAPWKGQYHCVAAAVTGLVDAGRWSALNPRTLGLEQGFPLHHALVQHFECTATVLNDAQAAAWGEYRFGAGCQQDMVFLTVSTGLGGGIVFHGRLLQGRHGMAGHFGVTSAQWASTGEAQALENILAGRWMAEQAAVLGHVSWDAKQVFAQAESGQAWASALVRTSAQRLAALCANIQLTLAPQRIVIGGGIGLAHGYLGQVQQFLAHLPATQQPELVAAALGAYAGAIGAADLAVHPPLTTNHEEETPCKQRIP